MTAFILALAFLWEPGVPPKMLAPYQDSESCQVEAYKRNNQDEELRKEEYRKIGAEYVCLKIERVKV